MAQGVPSRARRTRPSTSPEPARSRSLVAQALANGGLERLARRTWPDGRAPSLRWILCHMIQEYARHNGHADLLRESVDGLVGE
jgi:DNA-binding PucR family transcriptional regulator